MQRMRTPICTDIQSRCYGSAHGQNKMYALPPMRKKVLAEKSVEQGLNQFQFVEQLKSSRLHCRRLLCFMYGLFSCDALGEIHDTTDEEVKGCKCCI